MGFLGPEKSIVKELNMECDPRSNMKTPKNKYHTSVPKVYAAGDCRFVSYFGWAEVTYTNAFLFVTETSQSK